MSSCAQTAAGAAALPPSERAASAAPAAPGPRAAGADLPDAEVLVATTWDCNLRCRYCFVGERTRSADAESRMSADQARRLVTALHLGLPGVDSICIHLYGGEPLLNLPALRAMLDAADDYPRGRFRFAMTTNGALLSDEILALLDRGRFQVVLSIDGPADVHDACRPSRGGAATHARVMAFLDALRSRTCCHVRGSAVVRRGWGLAAATDYLRQLPVDAIKAQAVRAPDSNPFTLTPSERVGYVADLERIGDQVITELEAGRQPPDDRFANRVLQLLCGGERSRFCGAGETTFGVLPDGTITPCVLLPADGEQRLGHVDDPPAHWVSNGARWRADRGPRAECADCDALPLCGGGCPAIVSVCGADECSLIRKNCEIARRIHAHFAERPEKLLPLAGILCAADTADD